MFHRFTMSKEIFVWVGNRKIYLKALVIDWRKGCEFLMEFDNFDKRYNNLEWFNFIGYKISRSRGSGRGTTYKP
jgi:hypothetical protein